MYESTIASIILTKCTTIVDKAERMVVCLFLFTLYYSNKCLFFTILKLP